MYDTRTVRCTNIVRFFVYMPVALHYERVSECPPAPKGNFVMASKLVLNKKNLSQCSHRCINSFDSQSEPVFERVSPGWRKRGRGSSGGGGGGAGSWSDATRVNGSQTPSFGADNRIIPGRRWRRWKRRRGSGGGGGVRRRRSRSREGGGVRRRRSGPRRGSN